MEELRELQAQYPVLGDVRGLGLMVGCEFRDGKGTPEKASASQVIRLCLERGLLLLSCGPWDNTIRWIPPLIVSRGQLDDALEIFRAALEASV